MLEFSGRIRMDNEARCALCDKRLPCGSEAYQGFIPDSSESKYLCERCACIDENYSELDLSVEPTLLSVLSDLTDFFTCDCGRTSDDFSYKEIDENTIEVTCPCGKVQTYKVDLESLEDFFLAHSDIYGKIEDEDDEDEDEDDFDPDYDDYTEEELAKYTDDYIPDMKDVANLFNFTGDDDE